MKQQSSANATVASDSETEQKWCFQPQGLRHTCCTPSPRQQGTGRRGKLAWGAPVQQQVQHLVHQDRPSA